MSSNKALIIFVVFIWTIIGGYYLVADKKKDHFAVPGREKPKDGYAKMTAKLSAGVNVSFDMTNEDPKPNDEIEVLATINSVTGEGDYEYKIFMPNNTNLISPAKEGSIRLEQNQELEFKILFSQSVDYDMKIHMEIRKPGSPNASMFTFSTLDFKKNQEEVEALQERKASYSK